MTSINLTYYDERFGDRYEIELDEFHDFVEALRFVEGVGRTPIPYYNLSHIPPFHQRAIEQLIFDHHTKCQNTPRS